MSSGTHELPDPELPMTLSEDDQELFLEVLNHPAVLAETGFDSIAPLSRLFGGLPAEDGYMPSDVEDGWMCGISCAGLLVSSGVTVVTGGTVAPIAYFGAAACGSCMGFTWGQPPVEQGHIHLPSGGGYTLGDVLPSLPPGWIWDCYSTGNGWVCEPEPIGNLDPY